MRLENAPQFLMRNVLRRRQSSLDLGRMMSIVVYQLYTVISNAYHVESSLRTRIGLQRVGYGFLVNSQFMTAGKSSHSIQDVVFTRYLQFDLPHIAALVMHVEWRHTVPIELYIGNMICTVFIISICHHVAHAVNYLIYKRIGIIGHDDAVIRHRLGKSVKWFYDMFYILEIIQMIRINIEYHFDLRSQLKKAVAVLTCFCNKIPAVSHLDVAAYLLEFTSDQNSRLQFSMLQNQRNHRSGSRLAVCSAYGNAGLVFVHQCSQDFRPACKRYVQFPGSYDFRVLLRNGRWVNDEIGFFDVFRSMADEYFRAWGLESVSNFRFFHIWSWHAVASWNQYLGNGWKSNAAYTNAMNVPISWQVYHTFYSPGNRIIRITMSCDVMKSLYHKRGQKCFTFAKK